MLAGGSNWKPESMKAPQLSATLLNYFLVALLLLARIQSGRAQLPSSAPCDTLMTNRSRLAAYCRCLDHDELAIGELACAPPTDLGALLDDLRASPLPLNSLKINYMAISANLSTVDSPLGRQSSSQSSPARLIIDHLSIQLAVEEQSAARRDRSSQQTIFAQEIQRQMIDFAGLINETHLQFLSIFIQPLPAQESQAPTQEAKEGDGGGALEIHEINLAQLLAKFIALDRLEMSLAGLDFRLDEDTFGRKFARPLRWLKITGLAGSRALFAGSPFQSLANLEHLDMEQNELGAFPLRRLFDAPPKVASSEDQQSVGHSSLGSLSLAKNRLQSLGRDLFAAGQSACSSSFRLVALSQLDLSHNKIRSLTFEEAQWILCSMPNLNQLYLQHNLIAHLNLNSLLSSPIASLESMPLLANATIGPHVWSRLEHLDLSHNRLLKLTAFQDPPRGAQFGRLKSLNLAANRLQRPLVAINPQLIGRVLFSESFESIGNTNLSELVSLDYLDSAFELATSSQPSSICEALLPSNSSSSLIEELIVTGNELHMIRHEDFASSRCQGMQTLILASNRIKLIESTALNRLVKLEQLDLGDNLLDQLEGQVFSQNRRLKSLNLSRNRLGLLKRDLFIHLMELEELLLNFNDLESLPAGLFDRNKQLTILNLSNNRLAHLEARLFQNLKQLRVLEIQGNQLRRFTHHYFSIDDNQVSSQTRANSNVIRVPNLLLQPTQEVHKVPSRSNVSTIDRLNLTRQRADRKSSKRRRNRHAQADQESNNALILSCNQLELFHYGSNCGHFAAGVKVLWLNGNFLRELDNNTFKCMDSLARLLLSSNRLISLDQSIFFHLPNLEHIDLSHNRLASIKSDLLSHLTALIHLDLSENQLTEIDLGRSPSSALEYVDLSENRNLTLSLADLSRTILCKKSIRYLNLAATKAIYYNGNESITTINDRLYIDFLNLSSIPSIDDFVFTLLQVPSMVIYKIDLSNNELDLSNNSKRRPFILNKLQNSDLLELKMAHSKLKDKEIFSLFDDLAYGTKLASLDLQFNQLKNWPFTGKTAQKFASLRSVNLSGNQLRHLVAGDELISYEFANLDSLNLSSNSLIGIFDESALGRGKKLSSFMPKLSAIDLSHNRISWLPEELLRDLNELTIIKLDHNQLQSLPHLPWDRLVGVDFSHNYELRSLQLDYLSPIHRHLEVGDEMLIIDDASSWLPRVVCYQIDEYIQIMSADRKVGRAGAEDDLLRDLEVIVASGLPGGGQVSDELWSSIADDIQSIRLDSVSASDMELGLIGGSKASRPISLSLRNSGLTNLRGSIVNANIISLYLERNKIHNLSESICTGLVNLRTLDLSRNQLARLGSHSFINCDHLNYLDLSMNKIKDWTVARFQLEKVIILKLQNNHLTSLANLDIQSMRALRYLDLRSNHLAEANLVPFLGHWPHVTALHELLPAAFLDHMISRPALSINEVGLVITEPAGKAAGNHSSKIVIEAREDRFSNSAYVNKRSIRFCTLNGSSKTKVCYERSPERYCFYLKAPENITKCTTDLLVSQDPLKNFLPNQSDPLLSLASHKEMNQQSDDAVLSLIDSLRMNWLKFKEMSLNNFIMSISDIKSDSTWATSDGKYKINTLTALKAAMIGGAVCIIVLLTAIFYLLTYLSDKPQEPADTLKGLSLSADDNQSQNGYTNPGGNKWSTDSENSSNQAHQTSLRDSETCSSLLTKSNSDSSRNTMIDRRGLNQLNAAQLLMNQQCPTPSSSLGPSSVETGETMQAIDSLQSANSSLRNQNPYSTSFDTYGDEHGAQACREQPPVATVMRLVKSNSANFGTAARQQGGSLCYGTIRNQNYSTLRSRLRPVCSNHGLAESHYNPITVLCQLDEQSYDKVGDYGEEGEQSTTRMLSSNNYQQDPSTMSLLSINSALSSAQLGSCTSRQISPDSTVALRDQATELCQYHTRQTYDEKRADHDIILEVDEDQFQYSTNLPPPPPSIRSFEVLQRSNANQFLNNFEEHR